MATGSKTPTPSKDVDVFGKELGLTGEQPVKCVGEGRVGVIRTDPC